MSCLTHHFPPQFNVMLTMMRNRISVGFRFVPHPLSFCPIDAPSPAHPHRTCNILCLRPATAFPFPVCIFCPVVSPLALLMAWLSLSLYLSLSPYVSLSLSISLPPSISLARSLSLSPLCLCVSLALSLFLSLSLLLGRGHCASADITQTIEVCHCPEVLALVSDQVIGPSLAFFFFYFRLVHSASLGITERFLGDAGTPEEVIVRLTLVIARPSIGQVGSLRSFYGLFVIVADSFGPGSLIGVTGESLPRTFQACMFACCANIVPTVRGRMGGCCNLSLAPLVRRAHAVPACVSELLHSALGRPCKRMGTITVTARITLAHAMHAQTPKLACMHRDTCMHAHIHTCIICAHAWPPK